MDKDSDYSNNYIIFVQSIVTLLNQNKMITNKTLIITTVMMLIIATSVVAETMPPMFAPPTPPPDLPIPGIWALIVSGAFYGYNKLKK